MRKREGGWGREREGRERGRVREGGRERGTSVFTSDSLPQKRFDLELGDRRLDSETTAIFKQLGELFKSIGYRW